MKHLETVDYHVKAVWHAISRMYNSIAVRYGSSQTIGYVLLNVKKEGTPATKIAPLLGMEPTSLSRLLKNMEDTGLIYRQGDEKDKRVVRIFLTEEGQKHRRISKKVIKEFNKKVAENISKEDLDIFYRVTGKISRLTEEYKSEMSDKTVEDLEKTYLK